MTAARKPVDDERGLDAADIDELRIAVFFLDLLVVGIETGVAALLRKSVVCSELIFNNQTVLVCQLNDLVSLAERRG